MSLEIAGNKGEINDSIFLTIQWSTLVSCYKSEEHVWVNSFKEQSAKGVEVGLVWEQKTSRFYKGIQRRCGELNILTRYHTFLLKMSFIIFVHRNLPGQALLIEKQYSWILPSALWIPNDFNMQNLFYFQPLDKTTLYPVKEICKLLDFSTTVSAEVLSHFVYPGKLIFQCSAYTLVQSFIFSNGT